MHRASRPSVLACAAILALSVTARATIVVDPSGAGDFTTLQAAIDAARDGEQILVKAGDYGTAGTHIVVAGKGLAICAEAGALVTLPGLRITDLPEGHWVILRGLSMASSEPLPGGALLVEDSAGSVYAEDCVMTATKAYVTWSLLLFVHHSGPGAIIQGGGSLTLQRCTVTGGEGHDKFQFLADKLPASAGHAAVQAHDAQLVVQDCTLQGGDGGDGSIPFFPSFGPHGGAGLQITGNSFAHVAGSLLTGGDNGEDNPETDDRAGDGLYGEGPAKAWVKDSVLLPGDVNPVGLPGEPIHPYMVPAVTIFPEPARSLSVPSPLREGQAGSLQIEGQPGDLALLLVTLGPGFQPLVAKHGVLVLDPSLLFIPLTLGVITDAGGALSVPFVMPSLNPGLDGLTIPMQLAVVAGGQATIEAATAVAWLDAGL